MRKLLPFVALACVSITEPDASFQVPHDPLFYEHWSDVQHCSGLTGDPDATRRFIIPGRTVTQSNGQQVAAYYSVERHFIVIAGDWAGSPNLERHEILHALLRTGGHPTEYFVDRCYELVTYGNANYD